ncbi:hypothetical protein SEPCBS119000_000694 [Sporothrix epigloea]|uniref:Karyogamy protein n=1 Tax=Sporothrix epigloea TaxID=1892477 RepID=A0ABP0D9M9_9PEZI
MPTQPPSSIPTQQSAAGHGLSRTRSLRRPQAGPSASAAGTTTEAAVLGTGKSTAASVLTGRAGAVPLANRSASPSRLPTKSALSSTGTSSATGAVRHRPPSVTGTSKLASVHSRRPDSTTVPRALPSATSASAGASTTARPFTKPPSSSRSHLISSSTTAPSGSVRPTSSGGLPSSQASTSSSTTTTTTTTAPVRHLSGTQPATSTTSGPSRGRTRTQSASTPSSHTAAVKQSSKPPLRQHSRPPSATTLSSATTLRPPSAQSTSTGSSSPTSRPPTRSTSHTSATSGTRAQPTAHRRQWSGGAGTGGAGTASQHRPAFSTHQQHFSPAKNTAPKPRIAAILAPPASPSKKPANIVLSAETSRLQTTLLHLHLLHRNAAATEAEWHASARRNLMDGRFAALIAKNAELEQIASERAEWANAAALQTWAEDDSDEATLEDKIQALDAALTTIWSLAGQDAAVLGQDKGKNQGGGAISRYTQVVRQFEKWAQHTADLVAARRGIDSLDDLFERLQGEEANSRSGHRSAVATGAVFFSDDDKPLLDAAWHEECGSLMHRLEGCQQQLAQLSKNVLDGVETTTWRSREEEGTGLQRPSSLHRILAGCSRLVDGMLEELRMMQQLERDAAEQELAWIQQMNASVAMDTDRDSSNQTLPSHTAQPSVRAGACWRAI